MVRTFRCTSTGGDDESRFHGSIADDASAATRYMTVASDTRRTVKAPPETVPSSRELADADDVRRRRAMPSGLLTVLAAGAVRPAAGAGVPLLSAWS